MVVREFYASLAAHVLKKVKVYGVLVDFTTKSINRYYNLEPVNPEAYDRLHEHPNYPEVFRMLTNRQGEWKLNNEGHVVHFKAKHLAYIPKMWHHFITSRLIPMMNVCEVTSKRAFLNFAIIQDIPFDFGRFGIIYFNCLGYVYVHCLGYVCVFCLYLYLCSYFRSFRLGLCVRMSQFNFMF